ncbi:MAG TPA: isoprenylcysteine carboxylmethyltransferase family protein [Rhizomicrobium sp.]|jgi:protein-S-isoprenylcysteine O-methyltransferase Ste14|nr:isoprenylcysteine carboxylmethyltransferase family protein [Rhizomicrobium sp.]
MNALVYQPGLVIAALWVLFALSWIAAMVWSDSASQRLGLGKEIAYRVVLVVGGVIFAIPAHGYTGPMRLWMVDLTEAWICVGLMIVGFAFAWWARIYLGKLWSGNITTKADHRVVDRGPYAIVRHPIYTGILIAVLGTMIAKGTVAGIAGAVIITLGLWIKARLEEKFLREQLGTAAYDDYRRRVPMLMPFGPKTS